MSPDPPTLNVRDPIPEPAPATTASPGRLVVPHRVLDVLRSRAAAGYPYEVCGLLVGARSRRAIAVRRATDARNLAAEHRRVRYELDPRDFLAADAEARRDGLDVIGVWHTHPDHPARPSPTDLAAAWEGFTYLILSAGARGALEARAWWLGDGRFVEQPLEETEETRDE
jgi:proteasome lid subunit RPN8/RPN11